MECLMHLEGLQSRAEVGFQKILERLKVFDAQAKERYTKNSAYLRGFRVLVAPQNALQRASFAWFLGLKA